MITKIVSRVLQLLIGMLFTIRVNAADITADVQQRMQLASGGKLIPVIIRFRDRLDMHNFRGLPVKARRSNIVRALQLKSSRMQQLVRNRLAIRPSVGRMQGVHELWIINAMSAKVPSSVIDELSTLPEIERISLDAEITPIIQDAATSYAPEWNLNAIVAQPVWELGYRGQGVVVGIMDTGVDRLHQDLFDKWRGGVGGWFDPYAEHAMPYDASGHGTQVTGIVVGGNSSGVAIGVAPDAQWIAAKIFNDAGSATLSMIHQAYQWMLDPDNNPDTDDAPDIVNNSWNLQYTLDDCNTEFQADIDVLRQVDIAVVFSAGNTGDAPSTSLSPANNNGSLASGAVDESLNVIYSSARGPSACDGGIYPQLSAPGFNIYTSDLTFGGIIPDLYATVSGTSFAAAHVAGSLALLKSAVPTESIDEIESALIRSAVDVGASGADNDHGSGVLNIADAYLLLQTSQLTPVAIDDSYSMMEDASLVMKAPGVLANDNSPSPISAMLETDVSVGNLLFNSDGSFSYIAEADYSGSVWFEYTVSDDIQQGNTARVTVNVLPVNDPPLAINDVATTVRKQAVVIDVLANDNDIDSAIDPASIVISTPPSRGSVVVNDDGTVTYTSARFRAGIDRFSYQVSDMEGLQSNAAHVDVSVTRR